MGTYRHTGGAVAAAAILMTGSAAFADVTAQQVWDDWQAYMDGFGYEVTAETSQSGSDLTVSDIAMTFPIPEEEMSLTITMSEMTLTDNGDGTVAISVPAQLPITIGDGAEFEVGIDYLSQGLNMVVAGDPNDMTYTYSAASIGMVLTGLTADGENIDIGTAEITMADVSGNSRMATGNLRSNAQKILTGAVSYAFNLTDPDNSESHFVVNGGTASMAMEAVTEMPMEMDMEDMGAAVKAGFAVDGGYEFGPGQMNFNFSDRGNVTQGKTTSKGGSFVVALSENGIKYGLGSDELTVELAGGEIPFPVAMSMAEFGFDLLMPVSKRDEEQEFGLALMLSDFTMSDMIWGIFDPAAQLPRDPATIALDVSGMAKLFLDLLDAEAMESAGGGGEIPGELNALTVNDLTVSLVGAELTGTGDFVFDNTDLTSYEGMPKPVGEVNLALSGGNGLLDKLVAMGFVPEDQAMGARMMLGLFAVPGDGEDTLKSKIEFTESGGITANGQRLK
ncbi:DUF2125 domain-containing protein [Roseovarius pelagicus]|uniref:DUF2125 domain-containing protein n=1 Tax=Roseovarius pelagicus TaxID=2980108 RepID=A0ABY6DCQ4_9RHOB|nr:DUF2125 domain-containing protein [Roseovarius pelagicus]UXX81620.1 DUF2125 domain-containing protein [Roseovarius pelagicus]